MISSFVTWVASNIEQEQLTCVLLVRFEAYRFDEFESCRDKNAWDKGMRPLAKYSAGHEMLLVAVKVDSRDIGMHA